MNLISWRYLITPNEDGVTLSEHWDLLNLSPMMIENGQPEIDKRAANAKESIGATLKAMKITAES